MPPRRSYVRLLGTNVRRRVAVTAPRGSSTRVLVAVVIVGVTAACGLLSPSHGNDCDPCPNVKELSGGGYYFEGNGGCSTGLTCEIFRPSNGGGGYGRPLCAKPTTTTCSR